MTHRRIFGRRHGFVALSVLFIVTEFPVHASLRFVNLQFSKNYVQTGPTTTQMDSSNPFDFAVIVTTDTANDFSTGSLTSCGGGTGCPLPLMNNGTQFNGGVDRIPDMATFDKLFPFGTYTVTMNPGSVSSSQTYTQNLFSTEIPMLTASTFNGLNGLNPANALTLQFNSFTPQPGSDSSGIFLNIFTPSNNVFNVELPNSATSVVLPANSLLPNTTYSWSLAFENSVGTRTFLTGTRGQFTTGGTTPGQLCIPFSGIISPLPICTYQLRYFANLNIGDSFVNITNNGAGATGGGGFAGGNICVNAYVFDQSEEMLACCSCFVTPNGLASFSVKNQLISNALTPEIPNSVVIKLLPTVGPVATSGAGGGVNGCNASSVTTANLAPGMIAFGTTLHALPTVPISYGVTETPFSGADLSQGELNHLTSFCSFIQSNASGFGICKGCSVGGAGAATLQ